MQVNPHKTRTRATETSRSSAVVCAGENADRRVEGEEILRTLNPADVTTKFIEYAALEKHSEKLGLIDVHCRSGTRVGDRRDDVHAREQVWPVQLNLCAGDREHVGADVAGAGVHPWGRDEV